MHWTANLYGGLAALAVRIETLLIAASASTVRPPHQVAFALALYVWSLGDDTREQVSVLRRGAELFAQNCAQGHAGATGAGDLAQADVIGTDPAAAESPDRGSAGYRIPSLFRVAERTRLMHDGSFESLGALFDPQRAAREAPHPFGLDLEASDRKALLEFLRLQ